MVTLLRGDCLELMHTIPDHSVDLILADLPYGVTGARDTWDVILPLNLLWNHYKRLLKPRGAVALTATNPFASLLVMSNPEWFRYDWVWEKEQGSNFATIAHQPFRCHELVLMFSEGKITHTPKGGYMTYNPQMTQGEPYANKRRGRMTSNLSTGANQTLTSGEYLHGLRHPRSVQRFRRDKEKVHPTQKPVPLGEYLIHTYTNEGEMVMDNAMGSGSFGVAAVNTNRNFVGIERDEKYFEIAERRIAQAQTDHASRVEQARLFV